MNRKAPHAVTHWNSEMPQRLYLLALLGATNVTIAKVLAVSVKTVEYWSRVKPEAIEALRRGRMEADTKVVESFYKLCTGFEYQEQVPITFKGVTTIHTLKKFQPPNAWAAWKWLTNRQRDLWGEAAGEGNKPTVLNIDTINILGSLSTETLLELKRISMKNMPTINPQHNPDEEEDACPDNPEQYR